MDELKELSWNFKYKGKNFENKLREENTHGDFIFEQNDNSLFFGAGGRKVFCSYDDLWNAKNKIS